MKIERLEVQGYKSLYDIAISPANFTVLVGPNNAGKSNLVDAFEFLGDVHRFGLPMAVQRRGGFENIAHRRVRRTRRSIRFRVSVTMNDREVTAALRRRKPANRSARWRGVVGVEHEFDIVARSARIEADYQVASEHLRISLLAPSGSQLILDAQRTNEEVILHTYSTDQQAQLELAIAPMDDSAFRQLLYDRISPSDLLINYFQFNDIFWAFSNGVSRQKAYHLMLSEGRVPGVPSPNPELSRAGGNLPAVVWDMARKNVDGWGQVLAAMKRIMPSLVDIDTVFSTDRQLVLRFHEEGVGRPWTADEVSDGTIHTLALFVALHDRRIPFLILEEPENSVHPWILRVFVDECRSAIGKQIVITTHSPVVTSYISPDDVALVWRESGRSHVELLTTLEPEVSDRWREGLGSVYDFLDSGYIPQAVPSNLTDESLLAAER